MGAKYVNPVIKPGGPMTDLNGNVIQDANGHIGFPGFDGMEAKVSLSFVAQMQEAGVPVTYAYVSDAHDEHGNAGNIHFAYAPGEAGYVQQLHEYDVAFQQFFDRLAADGINKSNTLFLFTVDEGDHFAGSQPNNPDCDGVTVACDYTGLPVGEINGDLRRMMRTRVRRHDELHGAFGRRAERLHHRQPAADGLGHAEPRAGDVPAELAEPVHGPGPEQTSWRRSPTRPRCERCT